MVLFIETTLVQDLLRVRYDGVICVFAYVCLSLASSSFHAENECVAIYSADDFTTV